jgi:hypothetical protein
MQEEPRQFGRKGIRCLPCAHANRVTASWNLDALFPLVTPLRCLASHSQSYYMTQPIVLSPNKYYAEIIELSLYITRILGFKLKILIAKCWSVGLGADSERTSYYQRREGFKFLHINVSFQKGSKTNICNFHQVAIGQVICIVCWDFVLLLEDGRPGPQPGSLTYFCFVFLTAFLTDTLNQDKKVKIFYILTLR